MAGTLNLKKLASGKSSEFEAFTQIYASPVYKICMSVVQDERTARQTAIAAFVDMYKSIAEVMSYKTDEWVYRKTYIFAKNYVQEQGYAAQPVSVPLFTEAKLYDIGDAPVMLDVQTDIVTALAVLQDDNRELIYLRDMFQFDYRQIASMTGLSEGVIKARIDFGRSAIKNILIHKWSAGHGQEEI